ncbi:MAG TPA: HlyD family efflux transporter periplasmic adaptor subunit [Candidatus Melainabacteria bacterium]|nr:HlyD family efflux transporter periplasmic adaptor subunit [Candidatus Melainabacteria bacterium]HIN65365.1 HlyD family efflux transporter periplasmic adaptor subunit [Candidatus Obscuribacterales bacterium]
MEIVESREDNALVKYESLEAVSSRDGYGIVAILLFVILISMTLMLVYVPWQQSVSGAGKIIIFSPMERPQNIEAQIPARLRHWYVRDGQVVKRGELIAELSDLDPKFLDPEQTKRLKSQMQALTARRSAAEARHGALAKQLESLKRSQNAALPSAKERAQQAKDRIWAAEQGVEAARQNTLTTKLNLDRMKDLHEKGLRSKRDLELAELDQTRALTDLERSQAALQVAKRDATVAVLDQDKVAADTDAAMSNIAAAMAAAQETIESTSSEIFKLDIDLQNVSARLDQRKVYAPSSGKIVRLLKVGAGETVDAGMVLAVIAPETQDLAAELIISDNDAPLVAVGRPVRLQFAGWPALQFSGWPSIAVGTFGGRITVIDAIDDGRNNYRVIVKPDKEAIAKGKDEPWPDARYLRPGAEVSGWIMLDTVSLGFELWRQFNAFPPTVKPEELGLHKEPQGEKTEIKRKSK